MKLAAYEIKAYPFALGLPVRSVLRESSMMNKLWSSLMPAVIKGNSEAEDAPTSLALHLFDGMEVALALCKGLCVGSVFILADSGSTD